MKYFLIGLLLFTQTVFSQETPATFWNNRCDFKTDGTGKSLGLKIKFSVPCAWKQADGERELKSIFLLQDVLLIFLVFLHDVVLHPLHG